MDKIDILMAVLGAAAYMAIMVDLRNYERKMAAFEAGKTEKICRAAGWKTQSRIGYGKIYWTGSKK